jgi:hypothetical protein
MLIRVASLLCFALSMALVAAAQTDEPVLASLNMPKDPALARQASVEGIVKLTFTLEGMGTEPTNIQVISGYPLLNSPTIENLRGQTVLPHRVAFRAELWPGARPQYLLHD